MDINQLFESWLEENVLDEEVLNEILEKWNAKRLAKKSQRADLKAADSEMKAYTAKRAATNEPANKKLQKKANKASDNADRTLAKAQYMRAKAALAQKKADRKDAERLTEDDLLVLFGDWLEEQLMLDDEEVLTESLGDNRRWRYCKRSVKFLDDTTINSLLKSNKMAPTGNRKENIKRLKALMDRLPDDKKLEIANDPKARELEKLASQNDWKMFGKNVLLNIATAFVGVGVMVGNNLSADYRHRAKSIRLSMVVDELKSGNLTEEVLAELTGGFMRSDIDTQEIEKASQEKPLDSEDIKELTEGFYAWFDDTVGEFLIENVQYTKDDLLQEEVLEELFDWIKKRKAKRALKKAVKAQEKADKLAAKAEQKAAKAGLKINEKGELTEEALEEMNNKEKAFDKVMRHQNRVGFLQNRAVELRNAGNEKDADAMDKAADSAVNTYNLIKDKYEAKFGLKEAVEAALWEAVEKASEEDDEDLSPSEKVGREVAKQQALNANRGRC